MKLWDKGVETNQALEQFTVGMDRELDVWLAPYDVLGSLAHVKMLQSVDLLSESDIAVLIPALKAIVRQIEQGNFEIEAGVEDVHSQVELMLTRELGDIGKKIHSGRSRNDQVLVDLKLYFRHEIAEMVAGIQTLFVTLQTLSETHKNTLLPGYTHLQTAMPSSFGLWFGAYAESLIDDLQMFLAAYRVVNQNPLGSAAGYGSSFPLDRQMTTDLLGFEHMSYNVVYAQMGRGKTEKLLAFAIASLATTLNKLAYDVCLYMNQNFGFISFPDELTTGSSIMPHKKNPDGFEIMRAKSNRLQSLPNEVSLITSNLPSGYHRDLQLVKESLLPAIEETKSCLFMMNLMLSQVKVKTGILDDAIYDTLFTVEAVNQEVLGGTPFREAYKKIGKAVEAGEFEADRSLSHTHAGSIGNLCTEQIREKMQQVWKQFNFEAPRKAIEQLLA